MDREAARVQLEELEWLKNRTKLTMLFDRWDDRIGCSLYGTVASEVNQYPIVLSLDDMTGHRGSAEKMLETSQKALKNMGMEDGRKFIALTTDNPTVMQAFRRKFQEAYYWILVCDLLYIMNYNANRLTAVCMFSPWVKHHYWGDRDLPRHEEGHYQMYKDRHFL